MQGGNNFCTTCSSPGNLFLNMATTRPVSTANLPETSFVQPSPLLARPGFLIRRLHQLHCSLFYDETKAFSITPVQFSLMTALAERGELDQNGLAIEIGLERTSVAEVVLRLQDRGIVERRQSTVDGRVKRVRLTRKGKALINKMADAVQRAHDRTIDQLPKADRDLFLQYLVTLVKSNNDIGTVPFRLP